MISEYERKDIEDVLKEKICSQCHYCDECLYLYDCFIGLTDDELVEYFAKVMGRLYE